MSRRLTAAAALAVLGVATLPALPAFASAASSASITSAKGVYPGANSFTITVTNNESPVTGKTIDAMRVNLPVSEAGIRLGPDAGASPGFTATATDLGSTQFLTYRGGRLLPGQSTTITFPVTVGSPVARDLLGDFRVQVSSDNFATNKNATTTAGGLTAKVQVLEILAGSVKPVAPAGVVDGSGTAGQAVTFASTVKNHARDAVSVTTGLTSAAGDTATPATITVPGGGGTATAQIPVALGAAAADRSTVFTGTAQKADGSAVAPTRATSFTVQAPATVLFSNLQPTRTKSGVGSGRDFSATATKAGSQALNLTSATLQFGGNVCSLKDAASFPAGSNTSTVVFTCPTLTGTDGSLAAKATGSGTDSNDFAGYAFSSDLGSIVIDNLAPAISLVVGLPKDLDGDQQVATKNGDQITVSGTIKNAGDLAAGTPVNVTLQPNVGQPVTVPVTVSGSGEDRTYSGSTSTTWDKAATLFVGKAEARDVAGNTGSFATATPTVIDNALPDLGGPEATELPGVVTGPNKIEVRFEETAGNSAGGCDPNSWAVNGTPGTVTAVGTTSGRPCTELGDGGRVLTLRNALGVDETPRVTYEGTSRPLTTRPSKDGAGNEALRDTINTVTNLIPRLPNIVRVERRDGAPAAGFEPAFQDTDDKRYYTNTAGDQAIRLTVGGVRQGYTVEVLKNGTSVKRETFTAAPGPLATEYDGSVLVPLAAGDGVSSFEVRLISTRGNAGPAAPFGVVLDTVVPALRAATLVAGTDSATVTVPFSEKIARGTDFSDDWFVSETVDTENGPARRTVNANSVSAPDMSTRTLQVTLSDATRFAGADYFLQSGNGVRYEDRAGNLLKNTLPAS